MSVYRFEEGGRTVRLPYARIGAGVWIGWPGGARYFGPESLVSTPRANRSGASDEIRAPMTGRVVRVTKAAGETVREGEPIVIMEAMKMEYRLAAPRSGQVELVNCREGEQVDLGRTLVKLRREPQA
jgi:acetyl/propionyl-CoA carboxylase alpha subunit